MYKGKIVILLDAGHYAYYNQGIIKDYWESLNNWTQHLMLKEELERLGFKVCLTREAQEKDLALYDRGYKCLAEKADLFLSIHSNAPGNSSPGTRGVVVNYSVSAQTKDREMALGIAECIANVMGNGVHSVYSKKSDNGNYDYYGVLRGAVAGGCKSCFILERGFHTNEEDCRWLMEEANLRKLAVALADYLYKIFYGEEGIEMRRFELVSNMNVRKEPNGNVLGVLKAGSIISGTILEQSESGTQWLHIDYNGQDAVVAVLPESKGYAKEITQSAEDDYKALYSAEKSRADSLAGDVKELTEKNESMLSDIKNIQSILKKYA